VQPLFHATTGKGKRKAHFSGMSERSYTILRELSLSSVVARDASNRQVILKTLPPDCLLEGQLNPNIADRLRRVREIAMTDAANLRGVERFEGRIVLVWDFVEGIDFNTHAADPALSPEAVARLVRELIHTVQRFHATGLVHGALHTGNVLVDPRGRIVLIDVSPLLFLDPRRDERAVMEMCRNLADQRRDTDSSLASVLSAAFESDSPMKALATHLSAPRTPQRTTASRIRIRSRSLIAALVVLILGAGVAIGIQRFVHRNQPPPITPPKLAD
jgi:tRNA A-37 threonylcarbamoyl transferase component Bud32